MEIAIGAAGLFVGAIGVAWGVWTHLDANREILAVRKYFDSDVRQSGPNLGIEIVNRSKGDIFLREVKVTRFVRGAFGPTEMAIPARTRGFDDNRPLVPRGERTFYVPIHGAGSIECLARSDVAGPIALIVESTLGRIYECEDERFNTLIQSFYPTPPPATGQ